MSDFNNCQLQGYETAFPNSVYISNGIKIVDVNREPTIVKGVIILTRYTTQTEEDVVKYLQEKANKLTPLKLFGVSDGFVSELSPLEQAMLALPKTDIENIKLGHEDCIEFLKKTTSAPPKREKGIEKCIHLSYGLMPYSIIEKGIQEGFITDKNWYQQGLSDDKLPIGVGETFRIIMHLTDKWAMPASLTDMVVLLNHGTRVSDALIISTPRRHYSLKYTTDEAKEIVSAFYNAFPTVEHIMRIKDSSAEVLESCSKEPIIALLTRAEIIKKIKEKGMSIINLGSLLEGVSGLVVSNDDETREESTQDSRYKGLYGKGWLN